MPVIFKRDCWRENGYQYCTRSPWKDWVRWVVAVIIVVLFFLLFVFCACVTARRRRRAGQRPMWGTGWATRNGHGEPQFYGSQPGGQHQQQQPPYQTAAPYYYPQQGGAAPAPPYTPPPAGGYYANAGYDPSSPYPQQPQPAYTHDNSRAAENVYEPPPGPPPGKVENGVIR
ncbi:uncharacterized protein BKCO1_3700063 [Diplodia corticola]|uniref:Uncharacterized protein n=1 Tax=Diplodia corticola TaxID=236234 RepID=A0A1J9RXI2_9PEZI|nr:uncharacterized protein BKCO1_3700063 [Diplodia corticola]OJD32540.1 hypothetical protein BKCO1_3700063 [Diplodia corticola]